MSKRAYMERYVEACADSCATQMQQSARAGMLQPATLQKLRLLRRVRTTAEVKPTPISTLQSGLDPAGAAPVRSM